MPVIGIIAEYNPFHNGHLLQLRKIKEQYPGAQFICAISGSFTQRGEPAILDKWQRAKMAAQQGADLVLELPAAFAIRSAQDFARGGVRLLNSLGIVDALAFGSEYTNLSELSAIAQDMETPAVQNLLHEKIHEGLSYAQALSQAVCTHRAVSPQLLKEPNTILALEYLKAIKTFSCNLQPLLIERQAAHYHDTALQGKIASANAIRQELYTDHPSANKLCTALPETSWTALETAQKRQQLPDVENLFLPLRALLNRISRQELRQIAGINEGLENKVLEAIKESQSIKNFLQKMQSRRYPRSRLQRLIIHLLLGIVKEDLRAFDTLGPQYARVLSFTVQGQLLLRKMHKQSNLPVITRLSPWIKDYHSPESSSPLQKMLRCDLQAADLYGLCLSPLQPMGTDYLHSPYPVKQ